jgi:hypothetical protein
MSVACGLVGFSLYFWSIYQGRTKPHVFTWVSLALITGLACVAQILKGAGPGAWGTAIGTTLSIVAAVAALRVGHVKIKPSDWVAFIGALIGIGLWAATSDPLWAVVLASAVNLISMYPTIRKSFDHPETESISVWGADILAYLFSLFALQSFTLTTALFPAAIVVGNGIVVATVLVRRHVLAS